MSDNINVKPTPIQRNTRDVAIELVQLHCTREAVSGNEIADLYVKYFSIAEYLNVQSTRAISKLLPEEILKKLQ